MVKKAIILAALLPLLVTASCVRQELSQPEATAVVAQRAAQQADDEADFEAPTPVEESTATDTASTAAPVPSFTPEGNPEPSRTSEPTATPQSALDLTTSDLALPIYAAAIRHVYNGQFAFGDEPEFPLVYIISVTDDGATLEAPYTSPQELPPHLQQALAEELADQPFEIIWMPTVSDVPVDANGQIADGKGIYIILGNILPQSDSTVHLPLIVVCGPLCLIGTTYVLQETGGRWQVTGQVGLEVMG